MTVSYTHLDVYKRQVPVQSSGYSCFLRAMTRHVHSQLAVFVFFFLLLFTGFAFIFYQLVISLILYIIPLSFF